MARVALNRAAYVAAALELIDEAGVDQLSLRKVAARLKVTPMAMYRHFPAKEDLLAAALDEFIARADVIPPEELHWEQWIDQVGRGMYRALCSQLSWVPLLGSLRLGSQAALVTDAFVKKLTGEGFTMEESLEAYYAVIQVVLGAVCLRAALDPAARDGVASVSPVTRDYLSNLDTDRLSVAPLLEALLSRDQIDFSLPLLVEALRGRLSRHRDE